MKTIREEELEKFAELLNNPRSDKQYGESIYQQINIIYSYMRYEKTAEDLFKFLTPKGEKTLTTIWMISAIQLSHEYLNIPFKNIKEIPVMKYCYNNLKTIEEKLYFYSNINIKISYLDISDIANVKFANYLENKKYENSLQDWIIAYCRRYAGLNSTVKSNFMENILQYLQEKRLFLSEQSSNNIYKFNPTAFAV